jgi:hypothetical protein
MPGASTCPDAASPKNLTLSISAIGAMVMHRIMIIASLTTQALSPPMAIVIPLLLTEFCQVYDTNHADGLEPRQLTLRATTITVLLKKMLVPSGWPHGGIND